MPRSSRTRRPPDDRKETQTAAVWSCLPFITSGQNHLARHSERGKKTRRTKEEVGRQLQGMDMPGVRQVPEGRGEQGKMEKTGCKIICGAPTTLAVKELMMMIMMKGIGVTCFLFVCLFVVVVFFTALRFLSCHLCSRILLGLYFQRCHGNSHCHCRSPATVVTCR